MSRILRCLVCFFLICSLLVNLLPVRSDATGAGAAALITGAAGVSVAAPLAIGASLIALGIMANNTNPLVFENTVNDAVASLSSAGTWVKDGAVELLQTIDETGQKAYYVAGDMLEDLRQYILNESIVVNSQTLHSVGLSISLLNGDTLLLDTPARLISFVNTSNFSTEEVTLYQWVVSSANSNLLFYLNGSTSLSQGTSRGDGTYNYRCYETSVRIPSSQAKLYPNLRDFGSGAAFQIAVCQALTAGFFGFYPTCDLSLGSIPYAGAFTDGSSALEWAEEYARKALKVIEGGNDPDPDSQPPNDGKWFWPLALGLSVGVLGAMSQADEWSGQTPQEFNDYSTKTEFEILNRPEFDGWQGLEIAPATNPNPDPSTDPTAPGEPSTDPDPDPDPDPGTDPGVDPEAEPKTLSDVWQSIKELPSKITDAFSQKAPASNMSNFTLDLSKYFPFCIPFDLYDFFTCLRADPVAPVIKWEIYLPGGEPYPLEIDLSPFDSVAQLLRTLQLLLFCVGLAFKTRDLIKG